MSEDRHSPGPERPDGAGDPAFEALLEKALRIPVPPAPVQDAPRQPAVETPVQRRPYAWFALAASVLLAAGLWMSLGPNIGPAPADRVAALPADLMAHVHHEPKALLAGNPPVDPVRVEQVFERAGVRRGGDIGTVTYIKLCPFRGHEVAHFAVQGKAGPVTVMLLPDEHVTRAMTVREEGFEGTILPLPIGGSMAVVGQTGEDLEFIQDRLVGAIEWKL
jgi:hypothetical protein